MTFSSYNHWKIEGRVLAFECQEIDFTDVSLRSDANGIAPRAFVPAE
jgi:hypothetical protein